MCLAQVPQRSDAGEALTRGPSVSSQALYHWATALPHAILNDRFCHVTAGPVYYAAQLMTRYFGLPDVFWHIILQLNENKYVHADSLRIENHPLTYTDIPVMKLAHSIFSNIFSSPEPKAPWWAISSIPMTPVSVHPASVNIFKHLWNYWANWTQISYEDSLGWGNKSLFKWSWSHDQDGCHTHIW